MIEPVPNQWWIALRLGVYSTLLIAVLVLIAVMPLIALDAGTDSTQIQTLLTNKPWFGDFDKMAAKRRIDPVMTVKGIVEIGGKRDEVAREDIRKLKLSLDVLCIMHIVDDVTFYSPYSSVIDSTDLIPESCI